ncbi:hypothetical protein VTJ49DRAFT_6101 [Mycothermus thermophilus]|uniref:Uncharacterized protein n=1 Tax=Humicola insolens TaxID=85995 RepID=A0ABR3V207_HUMIN
MEATRRVLGTPSGVVCAILVIANASNEPESTCPRPFQDPMQTRAPSNGGSNYFKLVQQDFEDLVTSRENAVRTREDSIRDQEAQIQQARQDCQSKAAALVERNNGLDARAAELERREADIGQKETAIAQRETVVKENETALVQRETRITEREATVNSACSIQESLMKKLDDLSQQLQEHRQAVDSKAAEGGRFVALVAERDELKNRVSDLDAKVHRLVGEKDSLLKGLQALREQHDTNLQQVSSERDTLASKIAALESQLTDGATERDALRRKVADLEAQPAPKAASDETRSASGSSDSSRKRQRANSSPDRRSEWEAVIEYVADKLYYELSAMWLKPRFSNNWKEFLEHGRLDVWHCLLTLVQDRDQPCEKHGTKCLYIKIREEGREVKTSFTMQPCT